jgi:hypothetical protein
MIAETYTNPADRTKDELHALEADLKVLALSNKDISQPNKTLTDTIAAISHPLLSPAVPQAKAPCVDQPVVPDQGAIRDIHATSLIATPPNILPPIIPRQSAHSRGTTDHLQRCIKSVQDLATTISCALDALQGREKTGSSDINGSYASLKATMDKLPAYVQCDHCKKSVAWSHFKPSRFGVGQSGSCKCPDQVYYDACRDPGGDYALEESKDYALMSKDPCMEVPSQQSPSFGINKLASSHGAAPGSDYSMTPSQTIPSITGLTEGAMMSPQTDHDSSSITEHFSESIRRLVDGSITMYGLKLIMSRLPDRFDNDMYDGVMHAQRKGSARNRSRAKSDRAVGPRPSSTRV